MDKQAPRDGAEQIDHYSALDHDYGRLFVAYSPVGVSAVRPAKSEATFEAWFNQRIHRHLTPRAALPPELEVAIRRQMQEHDRPVSLDLRTCTDFERAVLLKTQQIPRGEVRTYAWIARQIGEPAAAQEVGTALSRNPILYLIPCHRVLRSDGSLAGYAGGGANMKRQLLLREGYGEVPGGHNAWTRTSI